MSPGLRVTFKLNQESRGKPPQPISKKVRSLLWQCFKIVFPFVLSLLSVGVGVWALRSTGYPGKGLKLEGLKLTAFGIGLIILNALYCVVFHTLDYLHRKEELKEKETKGKGRQWRRSRCLILLGGSNNYFFTLLLLPDMKLLDLWSQVG